MVMLRFVSLIAFSLLLHFLLFEVIKFAPQPDLNKDPTIVELIENTDHPQREKNFEKPFVKNTVDQTPQEITDPAQFLAEKTQRVEKQTKAQNLGAFQNAKPQTSQQKKPTPPEVNPQKSAVQETNGDQPEFARAVQQELSALAQASSVPYELPNDIAYGNATNLNADAHIYASFYNRILDLFYIRWSQRLNTIWDRLPTDTKRQLAGKTWSTELEIWLKSDGLYDRAYIMKKAGFAPFDEAGVGAFKDAKFFPNPPRAKVEKDGFIRLRYRIAVQVR